ncbi:ABC transporter permease [Rosettibacter firmus]|uniref:ABC transporter permease n=1 Tax=Rosettibacter firmus TaxID=3111522 RepID=UPI00336BCEE1
MARKYLKSKKDSRFISTISLITISGIAIGVCVVIIALTILDGFQKVVSEKIINLNYHIKVSSFGKRNLPDLIDVERYILRDFPQIKIIHPFISKLAIIKSKKFTDGITINGLKRESLDITLKKYIIDGDINLSNNEIILGKKLAEKLFVKPGDRVTIFSLKHDQIPTQDNPPSIMQFTVKGIYESGMAEYDDMNAYVDFSTAQELFGMKNEISGYNIKLNDISKINMISDKLQDYLGYPYYVQTVFNIHQNIFTWLELQKEPIPIILGLIIFVAVFNIVGTLLMIILERTNVIGILRSLGANRKLILKIFLIHGAYLTISGLLLGNLLAYILTIIQEKFNVISLPEKIYFVTKVPLYISIDNYLLVSTITILISFIASLLPAYIATKVQPISAIRFD